MNCPFCQASVRDAVFAESPYCLAICNIAPILPGHSMVIPKRHVARLNDLTNEEYNDLMNFMRTVSNGLMRAFAATGIDWSYRMAKMRAKQFLTCIFISFRAGLTIYHNPAIGFQNFANRN